MPWEEISQGHFEIALGALENFFHEFVLAGQPLNRQHYSITATVRFRVAASDDETTSGPFSSSITDKLVHAWKVMRYKHPELATTIDETRKKKVYKALLCEEDVSGWVSDTFIIEPDDQTVDSLVESFRPSPLASMHYLPKLSTIVFHTSHWRTDGIGTVNFLKNFFDVFAGPLEPVHFGDEGRHLAPNLEEAAQAFKLPKADVEEAADALINRFLAGMPSAGIPKNPESLKHYLPGSTRRTRFILDQNTTERVIQACKTARRSVSAAVSAAMVIGLKRIIAEESGGQNTNIMDSKLYTQILPFDIRPHVAALSDKPVYLSPPLCSYMTGLPLTVNILSDFHTLLDEFHAFYREGLSNAVELEHENIGMLKALNAYVARTTALLLAPQPKPEDASSVPALMGLGNVDPRLTLDYEGGEIGDEAGVKTFEVHLEDFWLGVENHTRELYCYQWTFRGKLELSACWNENFFAVQMVETFLQRTRDVLLEELLSKD